MIGTLREATGEVVCKITVTSPVLTTPGWQQFSGTVSLGDIGHLLVGERRYVLEFGGREFTTVIEDPPVGSTRPAVGPAIVSGRLSFLAAPAPSSARD